jgi:hypothetical protein
MTHPQAHRSSLNGARAPQFVHSPIWWRQYFIGAPTSSSSTPGVSNPSGWLWVASSLTSSANVGYFAQPFELSLQLRGILGALDDFPVGVQVMNATLAGAAAQAARG